AIGERGVVADRLARDEGREREEVQRVDRLPRPASGERLVGGAEMPRGIRTVGADGLAKRDLGAHALAETAAQRRDDEDDDRGAEDPEHRPDQTEVDLRTGEP